MTHQTQPDFYQQVEDFILCAVADNSTEDHATNTEIALFLLTLLSSYKKEQLNQAQQGC
ncbi:hypothetical protein MACH09_24470 [Vibrio sp. MACH09]|uniref:hypothetical protein n=1 Tax=unclassified Vibrio TaxID=2614977 RepID=UPI001493B693|nr:MULTISPECIES: hypothetical protein [unclassified Vibrio]GLO61939.1 hypothetical protein MACH09_24470 [Vibrio sp. MACH09]